MSNPSQEARAIAEEVLSRPTLVEADIAPLVDVLKTTGERVVVDVYALHSAILGQLAKNPQWFEQCTADHRPFSSRPYTAINPRANVLTGYQPLTPEHLRDIERRITTTITVDLDELTESARQRVVVLGLEPFGLRTVWALKRIGLPVIPDLGKLFEHSRFGFYDAVATLECCVALPSVESRRLMITFGLGAALLEIRQMALDALNEAGEQELAELVSHVHSGSADAASSLATLGSAGVEILASGLCCLDGTVAQSCADALGTIGETVVPFLVETARNSQRLVFRMVERLWAVRALGRTKSNAAVEVLKWIVAESEQAERRDYEAELTPRDPWLAEAKARLMTLWHNDYTRIRIYASEALGNIGSKPAIDALARLAKWYNWAESSEVKRAARKALQTIQT